MRANCVLAQTAESGHRDRPGDRALAPVSDRLRRVARDVSRLGDLYRGDPERLYAAKESAVVELRRIAAELDGGRR